MAYYWITESQKYIQSLGFGTKYPPVNEESQDVRITSSDRTTSFETDHPKDEIRYGKGGSTTPRTPRSCCTSTARDSRRVGLQFASEEAGAISEGFGDYWGVDMGDIQAQKLGVPELEPLACVMDWDATFYTSTVPHCLRRLDEPLQYPADLDGEVHDDGRIWSHALWDINRSIGHVKADTVILKGQINFPGTTMPDLAGRIVATAQSIYGSSTATKVRAAFQARGIL
jgi:hypothetical protein